MRDYRLGLALSGGGFRASLFHLGVLRRLSELGLLQHVTHISTVSGGSIVAAQYYLHFKRVFEEKQGVLETADYTAIVHRVEEEFLEGVGADIRNRLLANPLAHFNELTFGNGFGRRMARLYTRFFYRKAIAGTFRKTPAEKLKTYLTRGVPLHEVVMRRPGQPEGDFVYLSSGYPNMTEPERALVDFNEEGDSANIPMLVVNATCLNTGGPFYFTLNEVGGPECGFVRTDEVFMLLQYKLLVESLGDEPVDKPFLERMFDEALALGRKLGEARPELPKTAFRRSEPDQPAGQCFPSYTLEHLCFYQAARVRFALGDEFNGETWVPEGFNFQTADFALEALKDKQYWPMIRHLLEVDFGMLRRAKLAAWYLLDRIGWPEDAGARRGGFTREEYEAELTRALREIDPALAYDFTEKGKVSESLITLILDLYYFRSASVVHVRAYEALHRITLSHAVAASANFPPMFAPFRLSELFDTKHINVASLTDGGVHDNQGIEWLLEAGCTHIIASDAGGLVRKEETPAESRLPMMDRIIDVLMGGVRRVLLRSVRDACRVSDLLARTTITADDDVEEIEELRRSTHLRAATVFHMSSDPRDAGLPPDEAGTLLPPFAANLVAGLRTDLDAFSEIESAALRHQGYQLADCYGRKMAAKMAALPHFKPASPPPPKSPVALPPRATGHQRQILASGAYRGARYSVAYPFRSALLAAFIAAVISMSAMHLDDFTSWHSLRQLADKDLSDRLVETRVAPFEKLSATRPWQMLSRGRQIVVDAASHTSIITVAFICWALVLVGREIFRASDARRKRVLLKVNEMMSRDAFHPAFMVFRRPANLISLSALVLFASTLHVKWLFAVLHLWIIPLCLCFGFVRVVLSQLWMNTGRLDASPPPSSDLKRNETVQDAVA